MGCWRELGSCSILGAGIAVLAACGDPKSSVSGTVQLGIEVDAAAFSTLEIRAIEYREEQPDARVRPDSRSPFAESIALEELDFPYEFALVEGAFYEWSRGWAVAWLSQRGELEPDQWVLDHEPFGASRIELVEPTTHLAPVAEDALVILELPE